MGSLSLSRARFILTLCVTALFVAATAVHAQDALPPAHIAVVDGTATLHTERGSEQAVIGLPLIPGDRLSTTGGRVEILFPDGTVLDVDEYTSLDLRSETLMRLAEGRVLLTVAGANDPASALRYQIDTPVASARNEGPGEYRMALLHGIYGPESELAVIRGAASLTTENGSTTVRAGERTLARDNGAPSYPQRFNSARFDAFDQWTDARRTARLGPTASAQYLPRDLQAYGGTFDRSGSWLYEPSYGYVWYPTVAATWRPYYNGYWSSYRPYGWTWIGLDVWAYPTHHYGRWGVSRNRWFWIPDRRWAPAWVSWAAAPGYVSWCPLGFDNRPVISLTVRSGNPWGSWVLVPRHQFGTPGRHVQQYAVASASLPPRTPFVVQATAPVPPARAVPRPSSGNAVNAAVPRSTRSAPARASSSVDVIAGGRAVPRQGARTPSATSTATSPVFKLPLPETRDRTADPVTAGSAPPRSTRAPVVVPGARPSSSQQRDTLVPQGQTPPAFAPQARERAAVPRPGVATPAPSDRSSVGAAMPIERPTARPSVAMPDERPTAARPSGAMPPERPAGARPSGAMGTSPRTQAPPPPSRPQSAAPPPSAASGRAAARSAPAQPATASPPASPAPSSAPPASAPAGARARRAR